MNRHDPFESQDFLTTIVFTTSYAVCGLDYTLTIAFALGSCRLVSTRSKLFLTKLRSVLAVKPSPNLTGSTLIVSNKALRLVQAQHVYQFRQLPSKLLYSQETSLAVPFRARRR